MSDKSIEASSGNWLVPFLLLGLREWAYYGSELTRKMSSYGLGDRCLEEMYQALRQMEAESLVISEHDGFESDPGFESEPSRRRYSITEVGRAYLEFWADSLSQYREEIDLFFRLYNKQLTLANGS